MNGQEKAGQRKKKPPTANDRFKDFNQGRVALAVLLSVVIHYVSFEYFPQLKATDLGTAQDEIAVIDLPPEVEIPPPPEQIPRPATPRVAAAAVDEDVTIAPTTFEENPVESLPPPPQDAAPEDVPSYIPRDTEPRLLNEREMQNLLRRQYPHALREAGIAGRVVLWIYVQADGTPSRVKIQSSSGYDQFDETAQRLATHMRFSPAMLRDKPVGVWIALPITFSTVAAAG